MKQLLVMLLGILSLAAHAGTIVETEKVKQLKPSNSLSTCAYRPTSAEQAYFSKLAESERVTGSFMQPYSIHGKQDVNVAWFGIVRGFTPEPNAENRYNLFLEHKFFDGLSDCHIMLVSRSGGGDFHAIIETDGKTSIPALALVRIYGKVVKEEGKVPTLVVDYVRVWPWFTFTLTDLGPEDQGNPKWRKLCKPCSGGRVYNPYPTEQYYLNVLGDPKDFALQTAQGQQGH